MNSEKTEKKVKFLIREPKSHVGIVLNTTGMFEQFDIHHQS